MLEKRIEQCCKLLKLSQHMAQNSLAIEAESNQAYFLSLMEKELEYREEMRRERNLKSAGFHTLKHFDDFQFTHVKLPASIDGNYLKSCQFVDERVNLIFYGNCGTGKTHLTYQGDGSLVSFGDLGLFTEDPFSCLSDDTKTDSSQSFNLPDRQPFAFAASEHFVPL